MARERDLVGEFEAAYGNILADAERAAETTKTDAWHAMYQGFQEEAKKESLEIAKGLEDVAGQARGMLVHTDSVDDLTKLKKRYSELRDKLEAFKFSTVNPIKAPFDKACECITEYQGRAATAADQEGMYGADIEDKMAEAIAAQPKIRWNEKIGGIQVVPVQKPS